jgi:tetratricopeptide (TPR) repeat protein
MDGFSYYYTGDYQNALEKFNLILKENTNGYVYNLALYGKALIDSNNIDDYAGVLQSRDELLAHYLYIKLAYIYFSLRHSEGEARRISYLDAFIYFQNAIKLTDKNKTYLKLAIATSLYNLGNYDYALKLFSDLAVETNDLEVFYYAGIAAYANKDFVKAEKFLSKASESKDLEIKKKALMYLAEIYLMNKDDENFVNTASQLKEFDQVYAYDLLGWYFYLNEDYQNAFKAFKDSYMKAVSAFNAGDLEAVKNIIQNRNDRKSKFLLVYVYIKENKLEKARDVLKELLDGDDLIAKKAYYLYAYTFFSSGDFTRASQEFGKFLEKYENDDDIYTRKALLRLADSYYNLGERDLAINIYKDFITKYSGSKDSIDAAYNLITLESKGSSEDVESMIKSFLAKYPKYPLANILKIQLAEIYQNKGKIEDAIKIYQEVAASNSKESASATYKLAESYYKLNQFDKAKQVLIDYLNTDNEEYRLLSKLLLTEIYEKENDLDNSVKIYEELKENDDVKFKLAKILLQKGDYDKALMYFKELLERHSEKVNELSFYIGKTYYLMNDKKDAVNYLENGTKSSDYNDAAESYYLLGVIYNKENPNKALNYFLNGIYLYPEAKDIAAKSRIEAAKILLKAEKRKEASCLLAPLQNYEDENIKNTAMNILKDLPKCVR